MGHHIKIWIVWLLLKKDSEGRRDGLVRMLTAPEPEFYFGLCVITSKFSDGGKGGLDPFILVVVNGY